MSGTLAIVRDARLPVPVDKNEARREARLDKRLRKVREPIEPWDRYRALRHAFDEAQSLEDLADHKARFALILMGGLNAFLLFLEFRIDVLGLVSASLRPWVIGYLVVYGLFAFHFFLQAIEALRPRTIPRAAGDPDAPLEERLIGLRDYRRILEHELPAFVADWKQVRVGQLNSELVQQLHEQAQVNQAKMRALHQVYAGLRVMTLLMAGLVLLAAFGARAANRASLLQPHGASAQLKVQPLSALVGGLAWGPPAAP